MNKNRAIRYISIAAKAGRLVSGMDDCEKAIQKGKGALWIVAADAGQNTSRRAKTTAEAHRVKLVTTHYTKSELSDAIGRGSAVSLVLITDEGLAGAFAAAHATEQEECK